MLIRLNAQNQPVDYPITPENFRQLHPNVSFPSILTAGDVEPFGFGLFTLIEPPNPVHHYKKVVEVTPARNNAGVWEQRWEIQEMTLEEKVNADIVSAQQTRAERDSRLLFSDWTQLFDSPVNHSKWAEYRQALRDIPQQPGFPTNVTWPDLPQ
jgi:hypothetical protein